MGASLLLTREDQPDPETVRVFSDGNHWPPHDMVYFTTLSNSTSKCSSALRGMTGGRPSAP